MSLVTLADGSQINVTPQNQSAVTQLAINSARQQATLNSNSFNADDQAAITTAIGEAASLGGVVTATPAPTPSLLDIGTTTVSNISNDFDTGVSTIDETVSNAASTVSAYANATVAGLADAGQSALNGLSSLNSTLQILLIVGGIVAIGFVLYQAREL
jgi:hypothetical protein